MVACPALRRWRHFCSFQAISHLMAYLHGFENLALVAFLTKGERHLASGLQCIADRAKK